MFRVLRYGFIWRVRGVTSWVSGGFCYFVDGGASRNWVWVASLALEHFFVK